MSQPVPTEKTTRNSWAEIGLPIALFVGVLALWSAYWIWIIHHMPGDKSAERGQFGDMFGGITSLFSALAFAGLLYTIFLQRQELSETRAVMINQEKQLSDQATTLRLQQFESTFFQLVSLHHEIVQGMATGNLQGRAVVKAMFERAGELYAENFLISAERLIRLLNRELQREFGYNLGHYFRNLYHIAKFVHETNPPEAKRYMSLLRAQLSHPELVLLFINALDPKYVGWHTYIYAYALFEPMPQWRFNGEVLRLYNDVRAYGDNEDLLRVYRGEV